jgi:hypothetical protein
MGHFAAANMFCIRPRVRARGGTTAGSQRSSTLTENNPTASICDDSADIIGRTPSTWLFFAYLKVVGNFLPVSAAIAGFGDVDFQQ